MCQVSALCYSTTDFPTGYHWPTQVQHVGDANTQSVAPSVQTCHTENISILPFPDISICTLVIVSLCSKCSKLTNVCSWGHMLALDQINSFLCSSKYADVFPVLKTFLKPLFLSLPVFQLLLFSTNSQNFCPLVHVVGSLQNGPRIHHGVFVLCIIQAPDEAGPKDLFLSEYHKDHGPSPLRSGTEGLCLWFGCS